MSFGSLLGLVVWVGSLGWGSAGTGRVTGGGSLVRCWVLRERAGEGSSTVVGESLLVLVVLWGRLAVIPLRVVGVGGGVVLVPVCCLRTAQWTRASLWLSF